MRSKSGFIGIILLMCTTILIFLASCSSSSPDTSVSNFFNALINSDLSKAKSYLIANDSSLEFSNERNKNVIEKVFSMIKYDTISTYVNGDSAIVNMKVTTPDMEKITLKVINDVMAKVEKMSENEESIETAESEKIAEEYFNRILSDPKVQMTTSELEIKLIKENGKWLINGDKNFRNIITGNMIKSNNKN